jgi:hypothetical protein
MLSQYYRKVMRAGSKYNPIKVCLDVTEAASGGADIVRYLRLPFGVKILGGTLMADGVLANAPGALTINQGVVSAGNIANMKDYLEFMTATELAAAGVTVSAVAANEHLFTGTPATTLVPVRLSAAGDYVTSGSASDTGATSGTSVRARANLLEGDILIVTVAKADDSAVPVYHLILDLIPDCKEPFAAKLTEA